MTPSPTKQERVDAAYTKHNAALMWAAINLQNREAFNVMMDAADLALRDTLAKIERGE